MGDRASDILPVDPVWVQETNTLFTFKIILKISLFDNKEKLGLNQVILNNLLDMSLQAQPDGGLPIMYWVLVFYCIAYHYILSFVFHSLGSVAISVRSFYPDTFHKAAVSYAWFCCDHFLLKRHSSFLLLGYVLKLIKIIFSHWSTTLI